MIRRIAEFLFGTCVAKGLRRGFHSWKADNLADPHGAVNHYRRCSKCNGLQVWTEHSGGIAGDGDNYWTWDWVE